VPRNREPKRKKRNWRSGFAPSEAIQRVRPTESDAYLLNPHKGTTTFQRFNGDPIYPGLRWSDAVGPTEFKPFRGDWRRLHNPRNPDTRISYCRWVWGVIEPRKGKYRWDIIEGALKAAAERGQTLQARLQPSAGRAPYPDWFWKSGASKCKTDDLHPDFNCLAYVVHWTDVIRAFGKRFDGHPDLESFDVAYAGGCGETGGNATPETAEQLVDAYLDSFTKTQLLGMLGTHGCKYARAKGVNIGWRSDCFGDMHMLKGHPAVPDGLNWNHMYDAYPKEIWQCGLEDAWKTAPITFETCWVVGHWYREGWDIDWILDFGLRNHCSVFMPKSCYIPKQWEKKIDEFNKRLGYRFVLRQLMLPLEVKPGGRFKVDVSLENNGVAPIYRPYRLALRFRQGRHEEVVRFEADIRTWLPGTIWFSETLPVPNTLKKGEVKLDLGIVDASDTPVVRFAMKELLADGWHPMTSMDVV